MESPNQNIQSRFASVVRQAARNSGLPNCELARRSGLHRNVLRRVLSGERNLTLSEALSIIDASGLRGEDVLLFLLTGGERFALERAGTAAGQFIGELLQRAPAEILEQLGEDAEELRPRWANGAAKLLARTLKQHVVELNRRGDAIGERYAAPQMGA